jgi:hypothetical protein
MATRRQWLLQLGGGAVLAGWSGLDLDAAELPPGVYEASRDHLGHALAGEPIAVGGETELVQPRTAAFQPAFFSKDEYRTLVQLTGLLVGEPANIPVISEIAGWIDLTLGEAAAVRAAARGLSPAYRAVAVAYHGANSVRRLEEFDAPRIVHEGLAWMDAEARRVHGQAFHSLNEAEQAAILRTVSDDRPTRGNENAGTRLFAYLKERVIDGFYTSRVGLEELGYRGNAYYASPPGCEHLYG